MKLPILQAPDPRLRSIAEAIDVSAIPQAVVDDLRDTFVATENCVGLAAPQLGYLVRMIIVDVTRSRGDTLLMINPKIVKMSDDLQTVNDGCMSVRRGSLRKTTKRPKRLVVEWIEADGAVKKRKFAGYMAAVVHHEMDHLDGILFIDRLIAATVKGVL